jgi:hypothetical protein
MTTEIPRVAENPWLLDYLYPLPNGSFCCESVRWFDCFPAISLNEWRKDYWDVAGDVWIYESPFMYGRYVLWQPSQQF